MGVGWGRVRGTKSTFGTKESKGKGKIKRESGQDLKATKEFVAENSQPFLTWRLAF